VTLPDCPLDDNCKMQAIENLSRIVSCVELCPTTRITSYRNRRKNRTDCSIWLFYVLNTQHRQLHFTAFLGFAPPQSYVVQGLSALPDRVNESRIKERQEKRNQADMWPQSQPCIVLINGTIHKT
jgi:hypothetical protein